MGFRLVDSRKALERFEQADVLYREDRHAEALSHLEDLDRSYPGNKNIMYPLARCLAKLSRHDEALKLCDELVDRFQSPKAGELRRRLLELKTRPGTPFTDDDLPFEPPDIAIEEGITFETAAEPESPPVALRPWIRPIAVSAIVLAALLASYFFLFR